jgi:hypothetical protein
MHIVNRRQFVLLLCFLLSAFLGYSQKLRRSESFTGFHFDFHASLSDSGIGKTFTPAMVDSLLTATKPDYVQVDCKGHFGISSYPTKVGTPAPAIEKDILRIWRDVTNKHNVALYVHYSGILDFHAVKQRPHWARVNSDGTGDDKAASVFGAYCDSLLIPHLKELALDYQLDGIWVDGDCWALQPDYSPPALKAFKEATGITEIPRTIRDKNYFQFAEFNRKAFHKYVAKYVNALHDTRKDFQVASNWAYSSYIPEKAEAPVDFLSGDVAGMNSLYSAAFESRCLALQEKPWDLMSWSFAARNEASLQATKSFAQLAQEAAEVMAMGGGYQTYWVQNLDGSIKPFLISEMAKLLHFCRERQQFCHKGKPVPQIGLLYSSYAWRRIPSTLLYGWENMEPVKNTLAALLDSQLPVEILMDHHLVDNIQKYPVIIFPEWETIDPAFKPLLEDYVRKGGNLLIIGASAVNVLKDNFRISGADALERDRNYVIGMGNETQIMHTDLLRIDDVGFEKKIGSLLTTPDFRFADRSPLAAIKRLGKGKVGVFCLNLKNIYHEQQTPLIRKLIAEMVAAVYENSVCTVEGSTLVHQVVSTKDDMLFIHLINTAGQHNNPNTMAYEEVPSIGPLTIRLRLPGKPSAIVMQPENKRLSFSYIDSIATVTVPSLKIYSILQVRQK